MSRPGPDDRNIVTVLHQILENYYIAIRAKKIKEAEQILQQIRKTVLLHGIPEEKQVHRPREVNEDEFFKVQEEVPKIRKLEMTMRGRVWMVLLGINGIKQSEYMSLVKRRECKCYAKIRRDTSRTWATDVLFQQRVSETRLVRVLNSYTHKYDKDYVQGMDVLAGGMLFVMPEIDAFAGMSRLVNECFPLYWVSTDTDKTAMIGAFAGAILVKEVLRDCDLDVYRQLNGFHPYTYAFPAVSSISGIAPPFEELLRLWDFIFCFGVHVNVLCVAAQIILYRDKILKSKRNKILQHVLGQRKWPHLDARKTIEKTMEILPTVRRNTTLWERICMHTVDRDTAEGICNDHSDWE